MLYYGIFTQMADMFHVDMSGEDLKNNIIGNM